MKVIKFQGGGFTTFTPIINTMPARSSVQGTSSEAKSATSILDDDTFKELLTKGGLVNDVNSLVEQLIELESTTTNPFSSGANRSTALRMIGKVNELRQNKNMWNDAVSHAKEAGGLGEVAVGTSGEVYTKDKNNKVVAISLDEYSKHKDSVKLLSVSELMNERQYNPTLTGQNSVFNVADNAIGLSKINDHIRSIISAFGTEEMNDTKVYSKDQILKELGKYAGKTPTADEAEAVRTLMDIANTPGSLYKVKTETSSERRQAMKAVGYIWKTLGDPAQKKLTAVAAINGVSDPREFILDMISTQTTEKRTTEITPESEAGQGGASSQKSLTQFQIFHNDKLATPNLKFGFNDPKLGVLFRGAIGGVSPIITADGKSIGMTTIDNIFTGAGYNQIVDTNNVFFGDKKVNPAEFQQLIYDGADAAKVYMPVDASGAPDYKSFAKFKEIYAVYDANKKSWSAAQSSAYFRKNGYNIQIDESFQDGEKVKIMRDNAYVKPFLVMYAITNDATDLTDDNEGGLIKLSSNEKDMLMPKITQAWTRGEGKSAKNITPDKLLLWEDYYKGMVAIPYRANAAGIVNAMVDQGPREQVQNIATYQTNLLNSNQPVYGQTSASVLNQ